ncbi:MAG: hypothetical protein HQK52_15515 [Oligoflexia bacterium]|nr:hypothetical protein [Oligoflexia bacterium]
MKIKNLAFGIPLLLCLGMAVLFMGIPLLWGESTLPEDVFIKNPSLTTNGLYNFAILDGKIWIKKKPHPLRTRPLYDVFAATLDVGFQWKLLGETGLPQFDKKHHYPLPKQIVAISVDADHLVALGDNGRVYQYGYKKGYRSGDPEDPREYIHWNYKWGDPFEGSLIMPQEFKTFALGRHNAETMYYTDAAGSQVNYGERGISHLYLLSKNGQEINIADTGLPPDFSRQYAGPDRGRFIAANLDVAGEQMFVISKYGEMYTKFEDYDANGGTPFFKYYYGNDQKHNLPGDDFATQLLPRKLPLPDWKKQSPIPTQAKGKITKNITILVKGQGDHNRELRVQGVNSEGMPGYYFKMLNDSEWKFQKTANKMNIREEDFIENNPQKLDRAANRDVAMEGSMAFQSGFLPLSLKESNLNIEVPDFNLFASPITLRVHLSKEKSFDLHMHTVDSWFLFQDKDPEHFSNALRRMKGTLEIPLAVLNSSDPEIQEVVKKYFQPFHLKTFKFAMIGNKKFAEFWAENKEPLHKLFLKIKLHTKGIEDDPKKITYYTEVAQNPELLIDLNAEKQKNKIESLLLLIKNNMQALKELRHEREELRKKALLQRCVGHTFNTLSSIESVAAHLLQYDRYWNASQYVRNISLHQSYPLFETAKEAYRLLWDQGAADFKEAEEILQTRICDGLLLMQELLKSHKETAFPVLWERSFPHKKDSHHLFSILKKCQSPTESPIIRPGSALR